MKWKDKLARLSHPGGPMARTVGAPAVAEAVVERIDDETGEVLCDAPEAPSAEVVSEALPAARDERIARLRAQLAETHVRAARRELPARTEPRRTLFDDLIPDLPLRPHAEGPLPGDVTDTPQGPLRRVVTRYPEDHCHGAIPVTLALESSARDLSLLALDPALEGVDFSRALYIDTETTGLAGGAGTLPFLLGMAWFEGRTLVVEQLVLERPGLEVPMLVRFAELLRGASCVVSYNGKSFDWPLLRTRFVLNRVAAPPVGAHLDLLHCARRVYKRRLGAVRLVHLEEEVLGFTRVDDIAGALIPETYLGFLRGSVAGAALGPIIEHNRSDLVALSAILGELVRRFRGDAAQDARDQLGFATVAARADDTERAIALAHGAAEADVRGELAPEALYLAGELKQRRGDLEGARAAFAASVEAARPGSLEAARAHLALAKLYEHKLKEPERALAHAAETARVEGDDACARRIARLSKRGGRGLRLF